MANKGEYEIFQVGNEKIVFDSKEKIKKYAAIQGIKK